MDGTHSTTGWCTTPRTNATSTCCCSVTVVTLELLIERVFPHRNETRPAATAATPVPVSARSFSHLGRVVSGSGWNVRRPAIGAGVHAMPALAVMGVAGGAAPRRSMFIQTENTPNPSSLKVGAAPARQPALGGRGSAAPRSTLASSFPHQDCIPRQACIALCEECFVLFVFS